MSESKTYEVSAYSLVERRLRVVASSPAEAVEKAKAGEYEVIDSEPAGDVYTPRWRAHEVKP